ncbi:13617_t:CDS:2, partial [Racocetra persica]
MSSNPFSETIPFRPGNPTQLLNFTCLDDDYDEGLILLEELALRIFKKIEEPIAVITVVGSYRRGKSYFANTLLGRHDGFKLGSSVNGCTKVQTSMSKTKECTRCNCTKPYSDFISKKNEIRARCKSCCDNTSQSRKRKRQEMNDQIIEKENTFDLANITDYIYDILLEHTNLNEDFEGQIKFQLKFNINLDSIYEEDPVSVIEKDRHLHIASLIINAISSGDGYTYVYQSKYESTKQDFVVLTYWCNARNELCRFHKKVEDTSKHRSTEAHIKRYDCKGAITIKIYFKNNTASINISHEFLHPRSEKFNVTKEIKDFINSHIQQSVPDIYQLIKDQHINGFEFLTIQQVYYWWSTVARMEYRSSDNEVISTKAYLQEQKQEILFFNDCAFAFITAFFNILP